MNKKYSFDLVPPKNFKNDWIVGEKKIKKKQSKSCLLN